MIDFPLEIKCCPFFDYPEYCFMVPSRQDAMSNPTADFDTPLLSLELIRLVSVMSFTALGRSSPKSSVVIGFDGAQR